MVRLGLDSAGLASVNGSGKDESLSSSLYGISTYYIRADD